jgi:hypothetical protein
MFLPKTNLLVQSSGAVPGNYNYDQRSHLCLKMSLSWGLEALKAGLIQEMEVTMMHLY